MDLESGRQRSKDAYDYHQNQQVAFTSSCDHNQKYKNDHNQE